MTLDVEHPTLRVLQRLVPEAIAVGGKVATIASNNDKTIGNLIAEAMEKVGKDVSGRRSR